MKTHFKNGLSSQYLKVFVTIVIFLLGFTACRKTEKAPSTIRLLDITTAANIMETPFQTLGQHFKSSRETFIEAPVDLTYIFGGGNQRIWGFSTPSPILDIDSSLKPQFCRFYKAGKLLPYKDELATSAESWRWMKGEETFVINQIIKSPHLPLKKTILEHDCLLPEGRFIVFIKAWNRRKSVSPPRLEIFLDETRVGEITLKKIRDYNVKGFAHAGRHTLRILLAPETPPQTAKNIHLTIQSIKIKSYSDFLLLYRTGKINILPEYGSYSVTYIEEPFFSESKTISDSGAERQTFKHRLFQLHRLNQDHRILIGPRSAGENPFNLKKKISLENNSCNVLFAPTSTLLAYDLEIPEKALLEFGYGLLRSLPGSTRFPVEFSIRLQDAGEGKDIFSARIEPSDKRKYRLRETIDLEAYAGREVRVELRTRLVSDKPVASQFISDAYWFNPVLYPNQAPTDKTPNIILVSLDTLRPDHLKSFGYPRETGPHLDSLMRESVTFRSAISTAPSTLRAHMSLFTGLNTNRHQVYTGDNRLHDKIPTLTEILRSHGYTTCALTGGGRVSAQFGFDRGFDRYLESMGPLQIRDNPKVLWDIARDWLETNRNKRFFLFLHTYQIHGPYQNDHPLGKIFLSPNDKWKEIKLHGYLDQLEYPYPSKYAPLTDQQKRNITALYDGEIRYTDDALIKPLVDTLKNMELFDNTLIIIVSDHGEEFYEHQMWLHGVQLYDELIKVLCVIKFPEGRFKGHVIERNVRITDIMPTVLEYLDIRSMDIDLDGRDMMPLLKGKKEPERTAYADVPGKKRPGRIAVVAGKFKLILNRDKTENHDNPYNPPELELYNLESDPGELNNLADRDYATVKSLLEKIEKYIEVEKESRGLGGEKADLDPELVERLKALGYIN